MNQHSNPLVSIVVITYNSAKYVIETLESAKNQTYNNIELIISDDASSDNTIIICRDWIEKNKDRFVRIELINIEKNTGIPANCNRGVNASKGVWIKLIAGDDILLNECIRNNIDYVLKNPLAEIVFSQLETFGSVNVDKEIRPNNGALFHSLNAFEQFKKLLLGDVVSYTPTLFIKSNVYNIVGQYDEKYTNIEDYPFWLKATKQGIKLLYFNAITVRYRIHESSTYQVEFKSTQKFLGRNRLKHIQIRKDLVYPYLSCLRRNRENYLDCLAKIFKDVEVNSFNSMIYRLLSNYINPFILVSFILKRLCKFKNIDYNF